jgi:predicted nucleotidyltransferase
VYNILFIEKAFCEIEELKKIRPFIVKLVNDYKDIIEIWLFGSRAQGRVNANDWDLLVVTMDQGATLGLIENNLGLKDKAEKNGIHLFIHGNDPDALGTYICPWKRANSKARDKFTIREKFSYWINEFVFEYSGEHGGNLGRCLCVSGDGSDSFLNLHFYI